MNSHPTRRNGFWLALEGGGTRSQAVLMDSSGQVLGESEAGDVNTNFVPYERAQQAVRGALEQALQHARVSGEDITHIACALVGPRFGPETFGVLCPNAQFHYYSERAVVFARAGIYRPHGVGVVAATGATAWAIRADDGRQAMCGGWGALLGDEGSAYAVGLSALRAAARAYEGRLSTPTSLIEAICQHYGIHLENFRTELVHLAYQKPLSRTEVAGLAVIVARLAESGDPLAAAILAKVANDLANLALFAARQLFDRQEAFTVVAAGGLLNAGERVLGALRLGFAAEFPQAMLIQGKERPAVALGHLALYDLSH